MKSSPSDKIMKLDQPCGPSLLDPVLSPDDAAAGLRILAWTRHGEGGGSWHALVQVLAGPDLKAATVSVIVTIYTQ